MTFEKCYRVGGFVRDTLLGLNPTDIDYVVIGESPESMLSRGFSQVGGDFPVFLHPVTGDEYALARSEFSTGDGYRDFLYEWRGITLEQDLNRRDYTINAMAFTAEDELFDPLNGKQDLDDRVLRHITDDGFMEDPLRILRGARFAAKYDLSVAPETMALMTLMTSNGMMKALKGERIWKETEKAMLTSNPRRYFEVLDECGALKAVFPELDMMKGIPQRADYHAEGDVWIHTRMVLDEAVQLTEGYSGERALRIRMAALLHDLGKIKTPDELLWNPDGTVRGQHLLHEHPSRFEGLLNNMAKRLTMPSYVRRFVHKCTMVHQDVHRISKTGANGLENLYERLDLDRVMRTDKSFVDDVALMCWADNFGRMHGNPDGTMSRPEVYPQAEVFVNAMAAINAVNPGEVFQASIDSQHARAKRMNHGVDKAGSIVKAKLAVKMARRKAAKGFLKGMPETDFGPGR